MEDKFQKIVALAKRRGFFYKGSELYGGVANTYDYGPAGTELLRNIRNLWWETFVHKREDIVGLDTSVITHQEIWRASGHLTGFADAMIDCRNCKLRMRADHLIEDWLASQKDEELAAATEKSEFGALFEPERKQTIHELLLSKKAEGLSPEEMQSVINYFKISCPNCSENKGDQWTEVRKFNLLFPVKLGIVEGDQSLAYLRGETAQGMFINFKNVLDSTRVRLPFGIAQLGKSFRNEITPGNSVFRTLEFEQGEIEYFIDPETTEWKPIFEDWKKNIWDFVTHKLSINTEDLRWREHADEERSFYSQRTEDLEYNFPFGGFKELWGLAYRTDYDLTAHEKATNKELRVVDPQTGRKILPHVIEPAVGINRLLLMVLCDAYTEEENRVVLKIAPKLAPYKVAVFPLLANKPHLVEKAQSIYDNLKQQFTTAWDDRGNIGKRYLYQDEIGTPFCVTVDFDTMEDDMVTVRDRDSMKQERVKVTELEGYIENKLRE